MSLTVSILIDDAASRRTLGQLTADLAPGPGRRALNDVLGREAQNQLRRHFLTRNADSPNKQGWKRQNFWTRINKATAHDPARTTDGSATVVVADPALRGPLFGGTWGAKTSPYLAIPINEAAYGVRAKSRLIPGLFKIPNKTGKGKALGWLVTKTGKGEAAVTTFFYVLLESVTVPRDPRALPPRATTGAALVAAALGHLARRGRANNP